MSNKKTKEKIRTKLEINKFSLGYIWLRLKKIFS